MFALARFKNEEYTFYLACVWARTLQEQRIYIVFSMCLGSHASKTNNMHFIYRVFWLAREGYTLYLECVRACKL